MNALARPVTRESLEIGQVHYTKDLRSATILDVNFNSEAVTIRTHTGKKRRLAIREFLANYGKEIQ